MWGSVGALLFIAAAGGTAAYVAMRPTRISGDVMAADLLPQLIKGFDSKVQTVVCDDRIAVLNTETKFACVATKGDGTKLYLTYTMDRTGARRGTVSVEDPEDRFLKPRTRDRPAPPPPE